MPYEYCVEAHGSNGPTVRRANYDEHGERVDDYEWRAVLGGCVPADVVQVRLLLPSQAQLSCLWVHTLQLQQWLKYEQMLLRHSRAGGDGGACGLCTRGVQVRREVHVVAAGTGAEAVKTRFGL